MSKGNADISSSCLALPVDHVEALRESPAVLIACNDVLNILNRGLAISRVALMLWGLHKQHFNNLALAVGAFRKYERVKVKLPINNGKLLYSGGSRQVVKFCGGKITVFEDNVHVYCSFLLALSVVSISTTLYILSFLPVPCKYFLKIF